VAKCVACGKDVVDGGFCYHDPPLPPPEIPKKLFCVTQERDIYVLAVDQEEAESVARGIPASDAEYEAYSSEVTDAEWIPDDWLDAEPFGDWENLMTIRQWLDAVEANTPPEPPPPSHPLFPEGP
jgi:hypothetical protein